MASISNNDGNNNNGNNTPDGAVIVQCFICGFEMKSIQPCHLKCLNCGSEVDCSDKGWTW
jgi:hypothetical protein